MSAAGPGPEAVKIQPIEPSGLLGLPMPRVSSPFSFSNLGLELGSWRPQPVGMALRVAVLAAVTSPQPASQR